MVTELNINMKVITVTKIKGILCKPPGNVENTKSGTGQVGMLKRKAPYAIRNPAKVNASDKRKYHIINLP